MQDKPSNSHHSGEFAAYFLKRFILALLAIGVVLWAFSTVVDYFEKPGSVPDRLREIQSSAPQQQHTAAAEKSHAATAPTPQAPASSKDIPSIKDTKNLLAQLEAQHSAKQPSPAAVKEHTTEGAPPSPSRAPEKTATHGETVTEHQPLPSPHGKAATAPEEILPVGVVFVEAVIEPINYELEERFWGWRPNDIINVTDNINEYQLGVLEVTRRTVVLLTDRLSRTGYNDAIDRNLENAVNSLMVKADSYWFPSPESKYKESIAELEKYKQKLLAGKAKFYIRPDNLIPLFASYEDLLGSCDENLVKAKEADGSKVGFTKADNYFYYAKGVASAMVTILEAAQRDFATTLELRHGGELLHHAIESCRKAASLEPWIVTNGPLDGILANHRAHMAAPISHARFYMGQLIKTLST